jgi:hypothetical protein
MIDTNSTFGACLDSGCGIIVNCVSSYECHHWKKLDIAAMVEKYGRDHGALHKDLIKLPWKCERCGGSKVSFTSTTNVKPQRDAQFPAGVFPDAPNAEKAPDDH